MDARGAVDIDAEALAAVADAPIRAMRRLIYGRMVRLTTAEASSDPHVDAPTGDEPVLDLVGLDARNDILHVARLDGTEAAVRRLLEEPLRSVSAEDLPVEVFVLESETSLCEAVEHIGSDRVGHDPRFEGSPALRYILDGTGQSSPVAGEDRRREYIPPARQVAHDRTARETAVGSEMAMTAVEELFVSLAGSNPVMRGLLGGIVIAGMNMLGALLILVWRGPLKRPLNTLLGFTADTTLAASSTNLILPDIKVAGGSLIPVLVGSIIGVVVLNQAGPWIPYAHILVIDKTRTDAPETDRRMASIALFIVAITIHNMPESLAARIGPGSGDLGTAVPLMLAIGIQNIPRRLAASIAAVNAGLWNTAYATSAGIRASLMKAPLAVFGVWTI